MCRAAFIGDDFRVRLPNTKMCAARVCSLIILLQDKGKSEPGHRYQQIHVPYFVCSSISAQPVARRGMSHEEYDGDRR